MTIPHFSAEGVPIEEAELRERIAQYRVQGEPRLRRAPRVNRGGGFGDADKHPHAWGLWVMTDGVWRRLGSARGNPREWTSLDRAERWMTERGMTRFLVEATPPSG
jgi:hypothetical protein